MNSHRRTGGFLSRFRSPPEGGERPPSTMEQTGNDWRQHMAIVRSITFSILASVVATVAARRLLSVSQPTEGARRLQRSQTLVVVIPVFVGNSNNRIGWVKEDHHHHHSLFGRRGLSV